MLEQAQKLARESPERTSLIDAVLSYIDRTQGAFLAQRGDWSAAAVRFNQAVSKFPTNATAHYLCGLSLQEGGHYEHACACYLNAMVLDPDFRAPYMALGDSYTRIGCYQKALDVCRACLRRQPDAPVAEHVIVRAICGMLLANDIRPERQKSLQAQALAALKAAKAGRPKRKSWTSAEEDVEDWLQSDLDTAPPPDLEVWKNWQFFAWRPGG